MAAKKGTKKKKAKKKAKKKQGSRSDKFEMLMNKLKKEGLLPEGQKVVFQPSGEVKMSEVITSFIEPYLEIVHTYEEHNKLMALAVVAWNAALLPKDKQKEMVDEIIGSLSLSDTEGLKQIIEAMIERKRRYFPDNTRFIAEYHLSESREGFHLSVASSL